MTTNQLQPVLVTVQTNVHTCQRIHLVPPTVQPRSSQGQGNCYTHTVPHCAYTAVRHSLPTTHKTITTLYTK